MGYSLSLIAVQCADPAQALSHLGIVRTGLFCEYAREPMSGCVLPDNWFLIVARRCDRPFLKPKVLGPLSDQSPVVACSIEEHTMFSSAEYWADGKMIWRAEHVGEDGPIHLKTSGVLPPDFETMAAAHKAQQEADGGEKAGVDHYFGCNSHTDDTRWAFMGTTFSGKETSRRYSAETSFHAPSKRSLWARARKVRMA